MEILSPSTFHLFMSTSHAVLEVLQLYSQPVRCLTVQRIILDLILFFFKCTCPEMLEVDSTGDLLIQFFIGCTKMLKNLKLILKFYRD